MRNLYQKELCQKSSMVVQTICSARKAPPKNICKCQKPQNRTLAGAALPLSPTDQIPSADKIGPNSLGMTSSTQTAVVASSFVFLANYANISLL